MKSLPMYSAHFLDILCELLLGYRDSLQLLYKGGPNWFHNSVKVNLFVIILDHFFMRS